MKEDTCPMGSIRDFAQVHYFNGARKVMLVNKNSYQRVEQVDEFYFTIREPLNGFFA